MHLIQSAFCIVCAIFGSCVPFYKGTVPITTGRRKPMKTCSSLNFVAVVSLQNGLLYTVHCTPENKEIQIQSNNANARLGGRRRERKVQGLPFPKEPHIGQHKQDTSAGALTQTVDGIRRLAQQRHGGGGSRSSCTYRRTDWRAERTSVLQKGWLLAWCRSSMDLLQDLALSKKPSSPLSSPSKSNLGPTAHTKPIPRRHERKGGGGRGEVRSARQHGRRPDGVGAEGTGGGGVITKTVMKLHDEAQQTLRSSQAAQGRTHSRPTGMQQGNI